MMYTWKNGELKYTHSATYLEMYQKDKLSDGQMKKYVIKQI